MTTQRIIIGILAVLTVVAFGFVIFLRKDNVALRLQLENAALQPTEPAVAAALPKLQSTERPQGITDAEANAFIDKLEAENARLKTQLAELQQQADMAQRRRGGRRPPNLEELKNTNPELYAQIQQRREEFRQRREAATAKRNEYFDKLDTSRLNDEQRTQIERYRTLLNEADAAMGGGGNPADMREIGRELWSLRGTVQNTLIQNLGNQLGTDATALSNGLQEIMSVTGGGFGGGPGGPGGVGGGRGGRGGRGGFGGGPGGQ